MKMRTRWVIASRVLGASLLIVYLPKTGALVSNLSDGVSDQRNCVMGSSRSDTPHFWTTLLASKGLFLHPSPCPLVSLFTHRWWLCAGVWSRWNHAWVNRTESVHRRGWAHRWINIWLETNTRWLWSVYVLFSYFIEIGSVDCRLISHYAHCRKRGLRSPGSYLSMLLTFP
jgi:hypothetical protein